METNNKDQPKEAHEYQLSADKFEDWLANFKKTHENYTWSNIYYHGPVMNKPAYELYLKIGIDLTKDTEEVVISKINDYLDKVKVE